MNHYIQYETTIGSLKPNTVNNKEASCPFCNRNALKEENQILSEDAGRLLIKNKFSTFKDCDQRVFIESFKCHEDLSNYQAEELYEVLSFGLKQWLEMSENPKYQSVVYIKNHGSYSGASIHHPHMQIIGLENVDYQLNLKSEHYQGITIGTNEHCEWNISTHPASEFYEFNVSITKEQLACHLQNKDSGSFYAFATAIQNTIHYILNVMNANFRSYNLAFYELEDRVITKIIPRGFGNGVVNSVFLLGYNISQVPSNLEEIAAEIETLYINK